MKRFITMMMAIALCALGSHAQQRTSRLINGGYVTIEKGSRKYNFFLCGGNPDTERWYTEKRVKLERQWNRLYDKYNKQFKKLVKKSEAKGEDEFPDIGYLFKALPPFDGCSDLKEVVLPATIDNIGSYSFFLCSDLKTIRLPSTIRYLGDCVFGYCQSLTRFYINSAKPPQTHERCFDLFSPAQCTLYVPKGCKPRYQQAEGWKDFKKIVEQ